MALPLLLAVVTGLVWLLSVGVAQVRAVDAAREVARAVARGDAETDAIDRGSRIAPDSAEISVGDDGSVVTVTVAAVVNGPGGVLEVLPEVTVHAEAVAVPEGGRSEGVP